jgi:hypothetical protein
MTWQWPRFLFEEGRSAAPAWIVSAKIAEALKKSRLKGFDTIRISK